MIDSYKSTKNIDVQTNVPVQSCRKDEGSDE